MEGCLRPRQGWLLNGLFHLHIIVATCATAHIAAGSSVNQHHQEALRGGSRARRHRIGILRSAAASVTSAPATITTPAGLLVPLPNDTISQEYWGKVDRAIYRAGISTPAPHTLNDQPAPPEPEPFRKIYTASQTVVVSDTPQDQQNQNDYRLEGTEGGADSLAGQVREVNVVPYDMQLGARILYGLSPKNTQTPPPSQGYINEAFVAQCPMVMFGSSMEIRAATCQSTMGSWEDAATQRPLMRWNSNKRGGLRFSVDSAVSGNGSVTYADLNEMFTFNKYKFELLNCMGVMRYTVEEEVIKLTPEASTVASDQTGGTSYYYKYTIFDPNRTAVADTGLVRLDQNEVNFTESNVDVVGLGRVIAVATRVGEWSRGGWTTCDGMDRGWLLTFPMETQNFNTVATVQDLRVAAATAMTLMAFRDETVGYDGFQHAGQGYLYWLMVRTILWILFALLVTAVVSVVWQRKAWDKKLWTFMSKVETVLLPKRSAQKREPALHAAY